MPPVNPRGRYPHLRMLACNPFNPQRWSSEARHEVTQTKVSSASAPYYVRRG
jgi:hypothetical protein